MTYDSQPRRDDCPADATLEAMFNDRLDPNALSEFTLHLDHCPSCHSRLERCFEDLGLEVFAERETAIDLTLLNDSSSTVLTRLKNDSCTAATSPTESRGRGSLWRWIAAAVLLILIGDIVWRRPNLNLRDASSESSRDESSSIVSKREPAPGIYVDGEKQIDLPAAIIEAQDGSVIELLGNEEYVVADIDIVGKRLTLRAPKGSRPVLLIRSEGGLVTNVGIRTDSDLVLENLTIRETRQDRRAPQRAENAVIQSLGGLLEVGHCDIRCSSKGPIATKGDCVIANCLFVSPNRATLLAVGERQSIKIRNTAIAAQTIVGVVGKHHKASKLLIEDSSFASSVFISTEVFKETFKAGSVENAMISCTVKRSVLSTVTLCRIYTTENYPEHIKDLRSHDSIRKVYSWTDEAVVFDLRLKRLFDKLVVSRIHSIHHAPVSLSEWRSFWGNSTAVSSKAFTVDASVPQSAEDFRIDHFDPPLPSQFGRVGIFVEDVGPR